MTAINISAFTERISDRELEKLCTDNPETRFEITKTGRLIVMSPTGSERVVLQREEIKVKNQDKPWIILKFRQLSQIENE